MSLEVRDLRRVVGERLRLDGLSFTLEEGQRLAVLGPSGSGKTSLLRLLAWLDPPDGGAILLRGRDPASWGVPTWRRRVAYVAQRPARLGGTPGETWDFACGLESAPREVDDPRVLAARWSLGPEVWDSPWSELSGGEAQRAALALAMARRPDVLLLDEPTSALDPSAREAVEADLLGWTAVIVTHDTAQARRLCDDRLCLESP